MKKIMSLVFALVFLLGCTACGEKSDGDGGSKNTSGGSSSAPSEDVSLVDGAFEDVGNDPNNSRYCWVGYNGAIAASDDEYLYFRSPDANSGVSRVRFDGTGAETVADKLRMTNMNVYKGYLYYINDETVCRRSTSNLEKEEVLFETPKAERGQKSCEVISLQVIGNYAFFAYVNPNEKATKICAIDLNEKSVYEIYTETGFQAGRCYFIPNQSGNIVVLCGGGDYYNCYSLIFDKFEESKNSGNFGSGVFIQHTSSNYTPDQYMQIFFKNGIATRTGRFYEFGDDTAETWEWKSTRFTDNDTAYFLVGGGSDHASCPAFLLGDNLVIHYLSEYAWESKTDPYQDYVPENEEITEGELPILMFKDEFIKYYDSTKTGEMVLVDSTMERDPHSFIAYHKKGDKLYMIFSVDNTNHYALWTIDSEGNVTKKNFSV